MRLKTVQILDQSYVKTGRQKDKKERKKDKRQRPKREFNIATSLQFRTLAMFHCSLRVAATLKTID